jgi:hypothetical protein
MLVRYTVHDKVSQLKNAWQPKSSMIWQIINDLGGFQGKQVLEMVT